MREIEAASRYGNYEVLARLDGKADQLGGGSFGRTYKARHVFLGQVVALKIISEQFAHDVRAKERFLREARVVHGLRHPHIAQILDFGEADGTLYYAMEYCEGGNLEDLVRRVGPLDPATVELLARPLAEALECAHGAGFIHRDVKPANVMLAGSGDPLTLKLVDFGLVKPLVQDDGQMASLTLDGQSFFTPLFASPEQVMEEELDARSDLFSLGMTLWFLLEGAAPETGTTAVIMAGRLGTESYGARLPAKIPPRLRAILGRLLEKDKRQRFASASGVLAALASELPMLQVEETSAPPVPGQPVEANPARSPKARANRPPDQPPRLADKYHLVEQAGRSALGVVYRAARAGDGVPLFITVLDEVLRGNAVRMERLRANVGLAVRCTHEFLCQVYGLEKFADAEVLVREWNGGVSLQSIVKNRGSIPFAECLVPLHMVAAAVDGAAAAGMKGVRLAPDEIFFQPADGRLVFTDEASLLGTSLRRWPPFRLRLTPVLLEDDAVRDVSMTFSEQAGGSACAEFGSLLYRLVAGMQVKFAARMHRGAYIRTPGLSEEGNRILCACIAEEAGSPTDCTGLLALLQSVEGMEGGVHSAGAVAPTQATRLVSAVAAGPGDPSPRLHPAGAFAPPPVPNGPPPDAPSQAGDGHADASLPGRSPLLPVLFGLVVAAIVLALAAFFVVRAKLADTHEGKARPTAIPTPTAGTAKPVQAPTRAPTPVAPAALVLHGAGRLPPTATFQLDGQPVVPSARGEDLVFAPDPRVGVNAVLTVKTPGYRAVRVSVGADGTAALPPTMEREVVPVSISFRSRDSDYASITFSFAAPLPGENVQPPADLTCSLRDLTPPARVNLPTGSYTYTLQEPGQARGARVQPFKGAVTVKAAGRAEVLVPASFAGRFRGEFDDEATRVHVVRTISIQPGLSEGRCDEQYFIGGKLNKERSVEGVPLAEIRLDGDGVLHAHIRYALYPNPSAHNYDEVLELRHDPAGRLVMTGGREVMPDDPVLRSELERKLRDQPPAPNNRPGETVLRPAE